MYFTALQYYNETSDTVDAQQCVSGLPNPEESVDNKNQGGEAQLPHPGLRNSFLNGNTSASNVCAMAMGLVPSGNCSDAIANVIFFHQI